MNQAQKLTIDRCREPLVEGTNYTQLKTFLLQKNAVDEGVFQTIEKEEATEKLRNLALLEVLKKTDKGWEFLHKHFKANNQTYLSNLLSQTMEMTPGEIGEFVLHLQARLVKEYTRSVHSLLSLFQAPSYETFNDSTYVAIEMIRQEQESPSDREVQIEERSAVPEKPFERISGNTELLSVIYSENTAMLVPLIILGQPGQGKTTFVQKLVHDWAMSHKGEESNVAFQQISLLFASQLRNLKGDFTDIIDFILQPYNMTPANIVSLKEWIYRNPDKVLVILDGYDELSSSCKCVELEEILNEQMPPIPPRFPLIVTTRPYAVPNKRLRFQICELTKTQVREFVERRAAGYPQTVVDELVRFCQAEENAFLLSSPLLVHLICWVAMSERLKCEKTRLDLPKSQTQTYAAAVQLLSSRRNKREGKGELLDVQAMTKNGFVGALSAFAFNKLCESQEERLIFDRVEVEASNGVDVTKEAMTLGLLVSDAPFFSGAFALSITDDLKLSFPHKTFQEFFAAIHIVRQFEKDKAALLRHLADFSTPKQRTAKSLRLLLDDADGGENGREDALKLHRQILLFAVGLTWTIESPAANTVLQLVCSRILSMIRKCRTWYGLTDGEFVFSLLKTLSRELSESGRKELQKWAKANTVDIEHFASKYIADRYHSYTVRPLKGALSPLIDFLLHLGVGSSSFRSVEISGSTNALVIPFRDGELLFVGEFAMPAEWIRKAEKREEKETIEVSDFLFKSTASNLKTLFGAVAISASDVYIFVYPKRIRKSHDECSKQKMIRAKSVFRSIQLRLSSQLDASEVRSVFEVISRSKSVVGRASITVREVHFFFADDCVGTLQADDEDKTPGDEFQEIASISIEELDLGSFSDPIPTCSTFKATLACLREIDRIWTEESALPLLDEWFLSRQSQDRHHHLPHVRYVQFRAYSWSPFCGVSLATFVRDVKAQHLEIYLPDENPSKESFSVFCNALLATEENEAHCKQTKITPLQPPTALFRRYFQTEIPSRSLQKLTLTVSDTLTDESVLHLRDPLVVLLCSSEKLHLEIYERKKRKKSPFDLVCSALPPNLHSRVETKQY